MRLKDKVMVVTGGGSGIGQASALRCALEGARVVIMDIAEPGGVETEKALKEQGSDGFFLHADVTKAEDWRRTMDAVVGRYGRLDVLFNNAGSNLAKPVTDFTEAEWDGLVDLNLKGVFLGCKYVLPEMIRRCSGVIINTASTSGLEGNAGVAAYNAAKGGVVLLTKNLALDFAPYGIRAVAICPGVTETAIGEHCVEGWDERRQRAAMHLAAAAHPLGRVARPEEIASFALFLASDEAAFISGAALPIDGALTAGRYASSRQRRPS